MRSGPLRHFPQELPKYKSPLQFLFPSLENLQTLYILRNVLCWFWGKSNVKKKVKLFPYPLWMHFSPHFCVLLECYNLSPGIWNSHKDILCGYLKISVSILGVSFLPSLLASLQDGMLYHCETTYLIAGFLSLHQGTGLFSRQLAEEMSSLISLVALLTFFLASLSSIAWFSILLSFFPNLLFSFSKSWSTL